jgi:fatty acid desaturase
MVLKQLLPCVKHFSHNLETTLKHTSEIRNIIPKEEISKHHRLSEIKGVGAIFLEWTLIVTCAFFCDRYFTWYFYVLAVVFIGARLLALGLIMHEAVHQLISKNKFLNTWLAELLCAWPLIISMRSYKVKHLAHHAWLNSDDDPDFIAKFDSNWRYPMKKKKLLKVLSIQLSGIGVFETFKVMSSVQMKTKKAKTPAWYHLLRLFYYGGIITTFILLDQGMMLVLYWLIPFVTWTQIANRLRRIAEHSGIDGKSSDLQTRTTKHGIFARIFLAPKHISYHNEHHIYPGVPCYNLRKVHGLLSKNEKIKESMHVCKSYTEVYKECTISD